MKNYMISLIMLGLLTGCGSGSRWTHNQLAAESKASVTCKSGTPSTFQFAPLSTLPIPESIRIPITEKRLVSPDAEHRLRLDVCGESDNSVELAQVVYDDFRGDQVVLSGRQYSKGLADALFDQNYDGLDFTAFTPQDPLSSDAVFGIHLQGWRDGERSFVTAVELMSRGFSEVEFVNHKVLVGSLEFGNPFPEMGCSPGETQKDLKFSIGTALIEANVCSFLVADQSRGYRILKVSIDDQNPKLGPDAREKVSYTTVEEIAAHADVHYTHHNADDVWNFHTEAAAYRYKANALHPFSVRYGSGDWEEVSGNLD